MPGNSTKTEKQYMIRLKRNGNFQRVGVDSSVDSRVGSGTKGVGSCGVGASGTVVSSEVGVSVEVGNSGDVVFVGEGVSVGVGVSGEIVSVGEGVSVEVGVSGEIVSVGEGMSVGVSEGVICASGREVVSVAGTWRNVGTIRVGIRVGKAMGS